MHQSRYGEEKGHNRVNREFKLAYFYFYCIFTCIKPLRGRKPSGKANPEQPSRILSISCVYSLYVSAVCPTFAFSQKEYFQDDVFPDTTVTWEPSISAADWLDGGNKEQRKISLRPSDMKLRKY